MNQIRIQMTKFIRLMRSTLSFAGRTAGCRRAKGTAASRWLLRRLALALAHRSVGRALFVISAASGGLALALSAALHFGLLNPTQIPQADVIQSGAQLDGSDFKLPEFNRDHVLSDGDNRIDDVFSIPEPMRDRVGFWFDVYTKYDSNRRIIHHGRYPWIIFKVVDVSPIINSSTPRRRWMRNQKADEFVAQEAAKVRQAVNSLASKRTMFNLDENEKLVASALRVLGSDIKELASDAAGEVRVQTGQRDFFVEGLEVSPRYLGTMEEIFRKHRLPVELTRIPFVESSFNKHATSKVGASGIWQFMGETGRKFLVIENGIDERRSPLKATEAAARLLKENHMILHRSWPLAVTAWNHGPPGVRRAIRSAGTRDISEIVSRYRSKSFDFASSNFYAEFLAALHAEKYNREVFGEVNRQAALRLHAVKLPRAVRVSDLIRVSGLNKMDFLAINPDLRVAASQNLRLPSGFRIHVPARSRTAVERHFASADIAASDRSS